MEEDVTPSLSVGQRERESFLCRTAGLNYPSYDNTKRGVSKSLPLLLME